MSAQNDGRVARIAPPEQPSTDDEQDVAPEDESGIEDESDLLAELPDDADEIELTHAQLKSLGHLRLDRFKSAVNQLSSLLVKPEDGEATAPLGSMKLLRDLDLYDNRLSAIEGVAGLTELETFDMSFNLLRRIPSAALAHMSKLRQVFFIQNKISHIEGLEPLASSLTYLELGGNKLRRIENLSSLVNLTQLWLGKNKITRLEGLDALVKLRTLSIQSNRIVKLEGLDKLVELEELYISHNGLTELTGLESNTKLSTLDISNNRIKRIEGLSHLSQLEEFWASNNEISEFADVESQLAGLKQLETVYLEGNPLQKELGAAYRRRLMLALPQLKQIDATLVKV